jgi:hypothetical protein
MNYHFLDKTIAFQQIHAMPSTRSADYEYEFTNSGAASVAASSLLFAGLTL